MSRNPAPQELNRRAGPKTKEQLALEKSHEEVVKELKRKMATTKEKLNKEANRMNSSPENVLNEASMFQDPLPIGNNSRQNRSNVNKTASASNSPSSSSTESSQPSTNLAQSINNPSQASSSNVSSPQVNNSNKNPSQASSSNASSSNASSSLVNNQNKKPFNASSSNANQNPSQASASSIEPSQSSTTSGPMVYVSNQNGSNSAPASIEQKAAYSAYMTNPNVEFINMEFPECKKIKVMPKDDTSCFLIDDKGKKVIASNQQPPVSGGKRRGMKRQVTKKRAMKKRSTKKRM